MNAQFYVGEVNKAISRIKEAHALNVLNVKERNVEWTARTAVIMDISLCDHEISSEDYIIICDAISNGLKHVTPYIFNSRTDEP